MKYEKPEVVVLAGALDAIQQSDPCGKGSAHVDCIGSENTPAAYEADE
jgi:hypothetical protein